MPNFKKNKSAFMMKGYSYPGASPMKKDTGEVVSKTSPGTGWTKTKGTNIWAPPVGDNEMFGKMKRELVKKSKKTITNKKSMKPPYKKPVGPRA